MRDDLNDRTTTRDGLGMGTIAAIAAAVLIIGALFLWPRDSNQSASNTSPSTTVGQTRTAPAPTNPAPATPAPAPAAPSTAK